MSESIKKYIAFISLIVIGYGMYFGTILPIRKSQAYISTRRTQVNSLAQFNDIYDKVLGRSSPVGQEELTANYLELISMLINQEQGKESPKKELVRVFVGKVEEWGRPLIERGSGFSYSQLIFGMANVYRSATIVMQDRVYYDKAVEMYKLGLENSPNRQIFMFSLFDMYRFGGEPDKARELGNKIVEIYDDERIKQALQEL